MNAEYDLRELCALVDVTPRTVHFYIQQGLLSGPDGTGRGAKYGQRHAVRLRLIKRLQKEHLPLAEIRRRLDALTDEEAQALLSEHRASPTARRSSALDYVRTVLDGSASGPHFTLRVSEPRMEESPRTETARSTWERVVLNEDVELHIRRPLSRHGNRQLEKILAAAREVLKEEK